MYVRSSYVSKCLETHNNKLFPTGFASDLRASDDNNPTTTDVDDDEDDLNANNENDVRGLQSQSFILMKVDCNRLLFLIDFLSGAPSH